MKTHLKGLVTVLLVLLNALPTCWQVYPFVPASLLAPRRCIAVRKTVACHPLALGTLPPRHGSPRLQDDVSSSAKRLLDVLASRSNRSAMSCIPPGPKTTYRLPQNGHTPFPSLQSPSTWPWVSQASRRRIAIHSTPSLCVGRVRISHGIGYG